jgi:hypothetical protein
VVAALQELLLRRHEAGFRLHIRLHCLFEGLRRPFGIERIAVEVKAQDLALIRLTREDRRGRERLRGLKTVRLVVRRALLLGPVWRDSTWGLASCTASALPPVARRAWRVTASSWPDMGKPRCC